MDVATSSEEVYQYCFVRGLGREQVPNAGALKPIISCEDTHIVIPGDVQHPVARGDEIALLLAERLFGEARPLANHRDGNSIQRA